MSEQKFDPEAARVMAWMFEQRDLFEREHGRPPSSREWFPVQLEAKARYERMTCRDEAC